MRSSWLALLLLVGCGRTPAPSTAGLSVPETDLASLVSALDSEDDRVRKDAASRLRRKGEAALGELEKAKGGKNASLAAASRRVSDAIEDDLTDREREADDRFVILTPPAEPEGTWVLVAWGRLAATGASEDAVLEAAPGARHRYLWRMGERIADSRIELGSFSAGDYGQAVLEALGRAPMAGRPDREDWAVLDGSTPEDWKDAAVALPKKEARRMGLARFEIPGVVTVQSRMGAGPLARVRRARALARSADGAKTLDVTAWILED